MRGELDTYKAKRNFSATPEPEGRKGSSKSATRRYLIQRHAATRLQARVIEGQGKGTRIAAKLLAMVGRAQGGLEFLMLVLRRRSR